MIHSLVRGLVLSCLLAGAALAQADDHGDDHDHIEDCPPFEWGGYIDPGQQTYEQEVVAGFDDGRIVLEVRFDALAGPVAKHFMFLELIDGCVLRAVSVGSYMKEVVKLGKDVVHVDLYEPDTQRRLATLDSLPEIDTIRQQALAIFLGTEPKPEPEAKGDAIGN